MAEMAHKVIKRKSVLDKDDERYFDGLSKEAQREFLDQKYKERLQSMTS